jgi:hypothetical protein
MSDTDRTESNKHPYGYCPFCGQPGVSRERRPDGMDRGECGHIYRSAHALKRPEDKEENYPFTGRHP